MDCVHASADQRLQCGHVHVCQVRAHDDQDAGETGGNSQPGKQRHPFAQDNAGQGGDNERVDIDNRNGVGQGHLVDDNDEQQGCTQDHDRTNYLDDRLGRFEQPGAITPQSKRQKADQIKAIARPGDLNRMQVRAQPFEHRAGQAGDTETTHKQHDCKRYTIFYRGGWRASPGNRHIQSTFLRIALSVSRQNPISAIRLRATPPCALCKARLTQCRQQRMPGITTGLGSFRGFGCAHL